MVNFTSNTHQIDRKIWNFSNNFSKNFPNRKKVYSWHELWYSCFQQLCAYEHCWPITWAFEKDQHCWPPFQTLVKKYAQKRFGYLLNSHKEMVPGSPCHSYRWQWHCKTGWLYIWVFWLGMRWFWEYLYKKCL